MTFTRKERFGVLFLLVLISVLFVLPYIFKPAVGSPDPKAYEEMKQDIRKFESGLSDSSENAVKPDRYAHYSSEIRETNSDRNIKPVLFYFDPNRLTAFDCERLGFSDRLTKTMMHYIESGGRFRNPGDLKKLYGLHIEDYNRLLPYIRIIQTQDFHLGMGSAGNYSKTNFTLRSARSGSAGSGYYTRNNFTSGGLKRADSLFRSNASFQSSGKGFEYTRKKFQITDINEADSAEWERLPGIGARLASRIVHFREKLGGFYKVEQVAEIFGLPDSTYQKIKTYLKLNAGILNQIDLNNSTKETLQAHPYIRWHIAKAIIDYRQAHGGFRSVEELLQLAQMDSASFEKLKPYMVVKL